MTFYFLSFSNSKKDCKDVDFKSIQSEIKWFINKVKPSSFREGEHNVYYTKLYAGNKAGEWCITIGYIDNYFLLNHIGEYKYYFYEDKELILFDYSDDFRTKFHISNSESIQLLNNKRIITERIDMEMESIGTWPGYTCCFDDNQIEKKYYENSDEIPLDKAILKVNDQGSVIEIDSNTFKKMLKDK
jgi:hypothetical protein